MLWYCIKPNCCGIINWFNCFRRSLSISAAAAAAKSLQSCLTRCDPINGSPPGSTIPGILQARTLAWVAISFSNAWKWKVKVKLLSHVRLLATPWTAAYQAPPSMRFSRQLEWGAIAFSMSISSEVENVHSLGLSNSSHSICPGEWSSIWGVHILVVIWRCPWGTGVLTGKNLQLPYILLPPHRLPGHSLATLSSSFS